MQWHLSAHLMELADLHVAFPEVGGNPQLPAHGGQNAAQGADVDIGLVLEF